MIKSFLYSRTHELTTPDLYSRFPNLYVPADFVKLTVSTQIWDNLKKNAFFYLVFLYFEIHIRKYASAISNHKMTLFFIQFSYNMSLVFIYFEVYVYICILMSDVNHILLSTDGLVLHNPVD